MMKPFGRKNCTIEERIFNYRRSRARRVSENAFGIMANRFRPLLTSMQQDPKTVGTIVSACCCCLHNLMRIRYHVNQNLGMDREENNQLARGSWRNDADLTDLEPLGRGNRATATAQRQDIWNVTVLLLLTFRGRWTGFRMICPRLCPYLCMLFLF